ncbi:MAG: hypothetical protein JXP34_27250 [Planctomycetes bacterium]|nr:hypothetical protein [Planctomycetota bacterium]
MLKRSVALILLVPFVVVSIGWVAGCAGPGKGGGGAMAAKTFGEVKQLLASKTETLVLAAKDGMGRVAVTPAWAGRAMTSSYEGDGGLSLGWVNEALIEKGEPDPHFTNYGAEDRLWLGPEGGQFSLYHTPGKAFDFENWYVPKSFNDEPFDVVSRSDEEIVMGKALTVKNWSGTEFSVKIERTVRLVPAKEIAVEIPSNVEYVAYESINRVTNAGDAAWTKDKGLISMWILGMFQPSPETMVIAPTQAMEKGGTPAVKDDYFGKVPPDRLKIYDGIVLFKTDGQYRSKIGIAPQWCMPRIGSYDYDRHILTVVEFTLPGTTEYVNSSWAMQEEPFKGEAANSYNDGPVAPGKPALGGFYELESSSPALELAPGASAEHKHRTIHFHAKKKDAAALAKALLGIDLEKLPRL